MKKLLLYLVLSVLTISITQCHKGSSEKDTKYTLFITGASFASANNGWFELACKHLNAKPINPSVGGMAIVDAANKMSNGELYTKQELENMDAFVIMHVHNREVLDTVGLKNDYTEYTTPFDRSNYATAYDYVIKRYLTECYNLKFDKESKYYGTENGKPAVVVLCTHWHDGRVTFNSSIRKLGEKWGFPVVEFDKYIGFSKNHLHPVTETQWSTFYAHNNESIHGEEFGWHPHEGKEQYIQQRMAAIFTDMMKKVLPLKP
ncbi:DUF5040 domain-containing protein [Prevotella sp. 10(H)]|uniref:DUF5040 domain-containing protein n=1 Tax=Prevotella sp. 10(H) TaxID=1158294 RepID=UPI0004A6F502|nr:DUF5040 domain-containing protein [Prevotella sp. 10(H)]